MPPLKMTATALYFFAAQIHFQLFNPAESSWHRGPFGRFQYDQILPADRKLLLLTATLLTLDDEQQVTESVQGGTTLVIDDDKD